MIIRTLSAIAIIYFLLQINNVGTEVATIIGFNVIATIMNNLTGIIVTSLILLFILLEIKSSKTA